MRYLFGVLLVLAFAVGCDSTVDAPEENAVRVAVAGTVLQEGIDYTLNLPEGTITIVNSAFLQPGQLIQVDYEAAAINNIVPLR